MADPEQRERESRESEDTKFHEAVERERDERERVAEQVDEPLPERDEDDGG
jgi:hypothetical protein